MDQVMDFMTENGCFESRKILKTVAYEKLRNAKFMSFAHHAAITSCIRMLPGE